MPATHTYIKREIHTYIPLISTPLATVHLAQKKPLPLLAAMSDFDVPMKRYRFRHQHVDGEKYTLHCPFSISDISPDALVPVRQRGGSRDNEISFPPARELRADTTRDRRHNMVSHARLLRNYGTGLGPRAPVWIISVDTHSNYAQVVSLTDGNIASVQVTDLLCRPDRENRREDGPVLTCVGPAYALGTNRKGGDILWQAVVEQKIDGTDTKTAILKKTDVDTQYLHVKKERCGELLNLRERAQWRAKQGVTMSMAAPLPSPSPSPTAFMPRSQWLETVTNPAEETYSYWCVAPSKSRPAGQNPTYISPAPEAPLARHLHLANSSLNSRSLPPLVVAAAAAAAPLAADHGTEDHRLGASRSFDDDRCFPVPSYPSPGEAFVTFDSLYSSGVADDLWANAGDDGPSSPLYYDDNDDDDDDVDRCPECGTIMTGGVCRADWCVTNN